MKLSRPKLSPIVAALVLGSAFSGCTKKPAEQAPLTAEQLVERGRVVYATSCTACHNVDPAKDGSMGPAVAGASLALLERRILHADYPPGYTPKRRTQIMAVLPHLKADLPALFSYLSQLTPAQ